MHEKRFVPLFIAVLLSLLAGSTAQAAPPTQGPYDRNVVAKFVGTWRDFAQYQYPIWLTVEDRGTYALVRIKHCVSLSLPQMVNCVEWSTGEERFLTSGGKLLHYGTGSYGIQVWHEYEILPNGHLLERITTVRPIEGGRREDLIGEEFVRASGPPPTVPTRAPAQPPVPPVQPVVPGAGQTDFPSCSELGYTPGLIPQVLAGETPQCTKYVYKRAERKDLQDCWGGAYPNAKDWDDWARETWPGGHSQKCPNLKVNPPVKGQQPNLQDILPGDVVVWEAWCGGAKENGHVALATASSAQNGTIDFDQANWPEGSGFSHRNGVKVENCMSFIHKQGVQSTQQPSTKWPWEMLFEWIIGLFRH